MNHHGLRRSTVGGALCAVVAAAFLASAPIDSAAADGSATGSLQDLQAQCGTVLAQPGFASGAAAAACQSYNASYADGANGERRASPRASGEYPRSRDPNGR